jgi:hypothetical protein
MKYVITESQLGNIIYKYLDNLNLHMIEYLGDYIFWGSEESWLNRGNVLISVHRKYNDCFIDSDLVSEISTFFSLDKNAAMLLISGWVSTKVGFDVGYPYSDYGAS